ncbi:MAG TPA: bifunctional phosphoribosylaminoimidazolecarboxamide formyltransferase/IMP cyclohydrolase [Gammaproteobacteria bacterium]
MTEKRRALLSVSDKQGIVSFAKSLAELSFEIVSTGGTARTLRDAGVPVVDVADVTGFPEIMDGRVKTLHPRIHAGLLARAGIDDDVLAHHDIAPFDLLAVNLYPFERVAADREKTFADAIENIDIGGPAMIRAAAKNHERVTVIVDADDYDAVIEAYRSGGPSAELMRRLAVKAFAHTSRYDAAISRFLAGRAGTPETLPDRLVLAWNKAAALRYGENPHQRAALYVGAVPRPGSVAQATQVQGKPLSYINLLDADAAMQCAAAFDAPACVIVKHATPCGVAVADGPLAAYRAAYDCDPVSAFGGVIAFNRPLDEACAAEIVDRQHVDVIVAPAVDDGARAALAKKSRVRVIATGPRSGAEPEVELRSIDGGVLVQQRDRGAITAADLRTATKRSPTPDELRDLLFAWTVVKYVKSNAIVYARGGRTLGIGGGQTSRVMSAQIGITKAGERNFSLHGAAMASDAFFPFRDGIDVAAEHGVSAVIQPGGSVRDAEVIAAADERDIAMVFTGMRHFRH